MQRRLALCLIVFGILVTHRGAFEKRKVGDWFDLPMQDTSEALPAAFPHRAIDFVEHT